MIGNYVSTIVRRLQRVHITKRGRVRYRPRHIKLQKWKIGNLMKRKWRWSEWKLISTAKCVALFTLLSFPVIPSFVHLEWPADN